MRLNGSGWRFAVSGPQLLHIALFIRDSAGIQMPADPSLPPRLLYPAFNAAPHPRVATDPLGSQWASWWRQLVDHEVHSADIARNQESGQGQRTVRELADAGAAVFDAPGFASLADSPELRAIVVDHHEEAVNWSSADRYTPPRVGYPTTPIPYRAFQRAAENVAAEPDMPTDRLDAAVSVLDVSGSWSPIVAPGHMLCSVGLTQDNVAMEDAVRRAFRSRWDGPPS